jgi:hypothetical protein
MSGLQVGSDDEGYAVRLKMKHFLGYAHDPAHALAGDRFFPPGNDITRAQCRDLPSRPAWHPRGCMHCLACASWLRELLLLAPTQGCMLRNVWPGIFAQRAPAAGATPRLHAELGLTCAS